MANGNAMGVTLRPIYMEDLAATNTPTGDVVTETVLDQGPTVLTKIPIVLLTQLISAVNDGAAAGAGVPLGAVYFNTTDHLMHARLS